MRDPKAFKTSEFTEFVDLCSEELDDNDALLNQAKSAQEARLLEDRGLKIVHDMDELERGQRLKQSDDVPIKKKSNSSSLAKKKSKSTSSESSSRFAFLRDWFIWRETVDFFSGLRHDLNGAPTASAWYKLAILLVFTLYTTIVVHSTSLAFQVTKTELVDLSKIVDISKIKFSRSNIAQVMPPTSVSAPIAVIASSSMPLPRPAAPETNNAMAEDDDDERSNDDANDD